MAGLRRQRRNGGGPNPEDRDDRDVDLDLEAAILQQLQPMQQQLAAMRARVDELEAERDADRTAFASVVSDCHTAAIAFTAALARMEAISHH